jgi:hypothetical protein
MGTPVSDDQDHHDPIAHSQVCSQERDTTKPARLKIVGKLVVTGQFPVRPQS